MKLNIPERPPNMFVVLCNGNPMYSSEDYGQALAYNHNSVRTCQVGGDHKIIEDEPELHLEWRYPSEPD